MALKVADEEDANSFTKEADMSRAKKSEGDSSQSVGLLYIVISYLWLAL